MIPRSTCVRLFVASVLAFLAGGAPAQNAPAPSVPPNLPRLEPVGRFTLPRPHDGRIRLLSADGRRLVVSHRHKLSDPDMKIQVWDLTKEPRAVADLAKPTGWAALSPSGKYLAVSSTREVVDTDTGRKVGEFQTDYRFLAFSSETTLVLTSGAASYTYWGKGTVTVWDWKKKAAVKAFQVPDDRFQYASLANGGKELWLFMNDQKYEVECYDLTAGKLARTVKPVAGPGEKSVPGAGYEPSVGPGSATFASHTAPPFRIYDAATGQLFRVLPADLVSYETQLFPTGSWCQVTCNAATAKAAGLRVGEIVLYDWKAGRAVFVLGGFEGPSGLLRSTVSADGKRVVVVSAEGEGAVYDLPRPKD